MKNRITKTQAYGSIIPRAEQKKGLPWYATPAWEARRTAIRARIQRKQDAAHARAEARRIAATPRVLPKWRIRLNEALEARRRRRSERHAAYLAKHPQAV